MRKLSGSAPTPGDRPVTEPEEPAEQHAVQIHLDKLLADRGMTLTKLAEEVGVTIANLSVLKSGRARAIRFSTLTRICRVLDCQPGDLLSVDPEAADAGAGDAGAGDAETGRCEP